MRLCPGAAMAGVSRKLPAASCAARSDSTSSRSAVAGAGVRQQRRALGGRTVEGGGEQRFDLPPALGRHGEQHTRCTHVCF